MNFLWQKKFKFKKLNSFFIFVFSFFYIYNLVCLSVCLCVCVLSLLNYLLSLSCKITTTNVNMYEKKTTTTNAQIKVTLSQINWSTRQTISLQINCSRHLAICHPMCTCFVLPMSIVHASTRVKLKIRLVLLYLT